MNDTQSLRYAKEETSTTLCADVVVKSLDNIGGPCLDPRISLSSKADKNELDQDLRGQLNELSFHGRNSEKSFKNDEYIYIEFEGDQRNPINFSRRKKWAITAVACIGTLLASIVTSSYNIGFPSMIHDLHCTHLQATLGLSVYALGFAVVPLVTSSFGEEFGRLPLYIVSGLGFFLMFPMIALAKNIQTVIVARFLQGAFGSTGSTMVGGTISDIWSTNEYTFR